MAHALLAIPAALSFATQGASGIQQSSYDEGRLVVEWKTQTLYPQENKIVFQGEVKATYGVTILTCDKLTLFATPNQESGLAEGNVHIDDPEGEVDAAKLQFNWRNRTGEAELVTVRVDMMTMQAQSLKVEPAKYELTNVKITECGVRTPLLTMWSPSVTIRPGNTTIARKVTVSILGQKLVTLRRQELNVRQSERGLKWPSVAIRRGEGLGVTWQAGVPVTNSTFTDFRLASFRNRRPSASLSVSRSFLDTEEVRRFSTPRSDVSELFNFGYLENINVEKPLDEREYLSRERLTVSLGSVMNVGVPGRTGSDAITKPWDLVLEQGGVSGGFSMLNQVRLQKVGLIDQDSITRSVVITSVKSPSWRIGEAVEASVRADGRWYFNEGGDAKWGRLIGEAIWQPNDKFKMGVGYSVGSNDGDFAFEFDRLPRSRSFHVRTDLSLGPTKLALLGKYDPERSEWWDFEVALSQIAGCFEPYYIYRQDVGTSNFGIRFRVFEAFDRLRENIPKRTRGNYPIAPPVKKNSGHDMDFPECD